MTQDEKLFEKVIIIGGGPAGLSAAIYAARAELNPLVLTGMTPGGLVSFTTTIENYPGFPDGVGGPEIGELFQKQAEKFGARFSFDTVSEVDLSVAPFKVKTFGKEYFAESLIIATGASPVKLGIPGENEFVGKGVSYCATCDGWFFKGKNVFVIGGGDSALEEAMFLTRFAAKVTVIHRRDQFRAGALIQKRFEECTKTEKILDSVVDEILGEDSVKSIRVKNVKNGKTSEIPADGVFIFIGQSPNTEMFKNQLSVDDHGFIKIGIDMKTNIEGVFAAGEVADPVYKQVITSAGMGAAAAIQAAKYLSDK